MYGVTTQHLEVDVGFLTEPVLTAGLIRLHTGLGRSAQHFDTMFMLSMDGEHIIIELVPDERESLIKTLEEIFSSDPVGGHQPRKRFRELPHDGPTHIRHVEERREEADLTEASGS